MAQTPKKSPGRPKKEKFVRTPHAKHIHQDVIIPARPVVIPQPNVVVKHVEEKGKFLKWVVEVFKDERGVSSIKPIIAFLGSIALFGLVIYQGLYPDKFKPSDALINAIMVITMGGLGLDSADKFSFKNVNTSVNGNSINTSATTVGDQQPVVNMVGGMMGGVGIEDPDTVVVETADAYARS